MAKKRVLLTGAFGEIGAIIREALSARYDFALVSRRQRSTPNAHKLDVAADYDGLRRLMAGRDAVVHLAFVPPEGERSCTNEMMARNIYQAALETEPRPRVIVASSIHAVGGYLDWQAEPYASIASRDYDKLGKMPDPITVEHPLQPNGVYGAIKGYIELLGRFYGTQGLQVLAIRFGGVRGDDRVVDEVGYHALWLSRRDCVQVIRRALDAEIPQGFSVVFAVSGNKSRVHDLSCARRILGFEPQDDSDDFLKRYGQV